MECFWRCLWAWAVVTGLTTLAFMGGLAVIFGIMWFWTLVFGANTFLAFAFAMLTMIGTAFGVMVTEDREKVCKGEWP